MNVTFVFETWHIPDGNYPPLHVGQLVNLSFEIGAQVLKRMWWRGSTMLHHLGDGRYRFVADVIAVYGGKGSESLAVFDAAGFRFYIQSDRATRWKPGTRVAGEGMLMVDHYSWVERLSSFEKPPNLFYVFKVERIRHVRIPERFVHRHPAGKLHPTSLQPGNYEPGFVRDVSTMADQELDEAFFLVDLCDDEMRALSVPKTFHTGRGS
jgi:hypothetical protein